MSKLLEKNKNPSRVNDRFRLGKYLGQYQSDRQKP